MWQHLTKRRTASRPAEFIPSNPVCSHLKISVCSKAKETVIASVILQGCEASSKPSPSTRDAAPSDVLAFGASRKQSALQTYMISGSVTTAWRVLRLLMEEQPADMESSCEYIE
jgi:hypothetical protein